MSAEVAAPSRGHLRGAHSYSRASAVSRSVQMLAHCSHGVRRGAAAANRTAFLSSTPKAHVNTMSCGGAATGLLVVTGTYAAAQQCSSTASAAQRKPAAAMLPSVSALTFPNC